MPDLFKSQQQERVFSSLLRELRRIGYSSDLIVPSYRLTDWFEPSLPERVVPAAVFGQTPFSYANACFAILVANGRRGADLVYDFRALGAPFAFEVGTDSVTHWVVGAERETVVPRGRFEASQIRSLFEQQAERWSPDAVLRAKNISFELGPRQLDFIDLGLLPALESHVRDKLDRLLREVLQAANRALPRRVRREIGAQEIFRLVFRFLAAKVLHDRGVREFASISVEEMDRVLERVAGYYGESQPTVDHRETKEAIASILWNRLDFTNLSVEVLAYIYENTLVSEFSREKLGTHSTPSSVARYIVRRLPFESFPQEQRCVLEPCSGHAIFLVAALQRLRELLPADVDEKARHRYFVKMLRGYEIDSFAVEISKLCLVLADFPNHNGWKLHQEDVFQSAGMLRDLASTRIVLCNPPFEDFDKSERSKYAHLDSVHKPAEMLHRVLRHIHPEATLGFVLPRQFIDGRGYREIRELIARRYQDLEVVALPDGIFQQSDLETALLLARNPARSAQRVSLTYGQVEDADRKQFLSGGGVSRRENAIRSPAQLSDSLSLVTLREVWGALAGALTLGELAEIHRGVEWQAPFNEDKYVSPRPKPGFKPGLLNVTDRFSAFVPPGVAYLSTRPDYRRGGAFDYSWDKPKVIANAARVSRGKWRLAAFSDYEGLICSQRFHAIWPTDGLRVEVLEAVLNGPVANAYVASREGQRDIRKKTLAGVPFPRLDRAQGEAIAELVGRLRTWLERKDVPFLGNLGDWEAKARELLLAVDAAVLRAYDLPPRLERTLLDAFHGESRRVPFPFTMYYDPAFVPWLPLWMTLSPDYARCNAEFLRRSLPRITDPQLISALTDVE